MEAGRAGFLAQEGFEAERARNRQYVLAGAFTGSGQGDVMARQNRVSRLLKLIHEARKKAGEPAAAAAVPRPAPPSVPAPSASPPPAPAPAPAPPPPEPPPAAPTPPAPASRGATLLVEYVGGSNDRVLEGAALELVARGTAGHRPRGGLRGAAIAGSLRARRGACFFRSFRKHDPRKFGEGDANGVLKAIGEARRRLGKKNGFLALLACAWSARLATEGNDAAVRRWAPEFELSGARIGTDRVWGTAAGFAMSELREIRDPDEEARVVAGTKNARTRRRSGSGCGTSFRDPGRGFRGRRRSKDVPVVEEAGRVQGPVPAYSGLAPPPHALPDMRGLGAGGRYGLRQRPADGAMRYVRRDRGWRRCRGVRDAAGQTARGIRGMRARGATGAGR